MDLREEIDKKLGEVNTVQLQGPNSTTTFLWNQDMYRWVEQHEGASQRRLVGYQLRELLVDIPHTSRRKGSILIVTQVDTTKKIE